MNIGLVTFVTDQSMSFPRLAQEAEARGFESLFVPDKTHLPVSRRTPWPGGDLPETYKRTYDRVVVLAAAAAVTSRLKLAYPGMIALLLAFIACQAYRLVVRVTVGLTPLTVFDAFVVWLTWRD